jgi:recombinational DNA repair protein (RecF pathway)
MSYAVYTTRGFILGSAPNGEASKIYTIYTEDFGLVRAKAQSVRLLASKLRFHLTDFSFCTFSLVRGKELWRITGSQSEPIAADRLSMSARILSLLKKLVHGEERNDALFNALLALTQSEKVSEISVLSHILAALGYLDLSALVGADEKTVVSAINKALKETQL